MAVRCARGRRDDGFTLAELMAVVMVLAALTSIVIVATSDSQVRAERAVLESNRSTVAKMIDTYRTQGLKTVYRRNGAGDETYISTAFEAQHETLIPGGYSNDFGLRNPVSKLGVIVNWNSVAVPARYQPPALFLTDGTSYRYGSYTNSSANRARLAGCIVACWNTPRGMIEVYYVDRWGVKSPKAILTPISSP